MKENDIELEKQLEEEKKGNKAFKKKSTLEKELNLETDIEKTSIEILNQYSKGIDSIIETPSPKEDEVYILFILNCPSNFSLKYEGNYKKDSSIFHNILIAKFIQQQTSNYNKIFNPNKNYDFNNTSQKDFETISDEVSKRIFELKKYKNLLHEVFELFEKSTSDLIDNILLKFLKKKKEKIKK